MRRIVLLVLHTVAPKMQVYLTLTLIHSYASEKPLTMVRGFSLIAKPLWPVIQFVYMKLTLQTQLLPDREQIHRLKETLTAFNSACSWLAKKAFELQCPNKIELQKLFYQEIRLRFNLSAQMTVRAIAQTVEAYKRDKSICPKFRKFAAMPYDQRIMSFKGLDRVSLLTLHGRIVVPFLMGKYQAERFTNAKGQADLVYRERDNKWFLLITVDVPDGTKITVTDFIGIDIGIVNLITTSDGVAQSGESVKLIQEKYAVLRKSLQQKASKQSQSGKRPRGVRRFQKRISKRVANFKRHVNHCISKKIVALAIDTRKGIALEDLKGIRDRCEKRFRKEQRSIFSSWSFYQLRLFITYKASLAGIPVFFVNPQNTSRECSSCGHTEKANRISQSEFLCKQCNLHISADINAAINIRGRASVSNAQRSESVALSNASLLQV